MNKEEFCQRQSIVANFYKNAVKNHHLPHAILLYGDADSPLSQVATYLAKSIFCNEEFACEKCHYCKQFNAHQLFDFCEVDGRSNMIKKEDINQLSSAFNLSIRNAKQVAVYIIHEVSNMTGEAANALLKFLEEPPKGVQAILTTTSKEKLLPTILSRVVSLRVLPDIKSFEEGTVSSKMEYVLTHLPGDEKVLELANDKQFEEVFELADKFTDTIMYSLPNALNILFSEVLPTIKEPKCYNYFYSVVYQIFMAVIRKDTDSPFNDLIIGLKKHQKNIVKAAAFLEEIIASSRVNLNASLVLGKLSYILEANYE